MTVNTCFASGQKALSRSAQWASAERVLQDTRQYNKAPVLQDFTIIHGEKERFQRTANRDSQQNHFFSSYCNYMKTFNYF